MKNEKISTLKFKSWLGFKFTFLADMSAKNVSVFLGGSPKPQRMYVFLLLSIVLWQLSKDIKTHQK